MLDLAHVLAGPVATRCLAGLGTSVLRIDPPGRDEPSLAPETTPGKRCTRLAPRKPAGRARFEALLASADILSVLHIDPPGRDKPSLAPETTPGKRCTRLAPREPADRARFEAPLASADILSVLRIDPPGRDKPSLAPEATPGKRRTRLDLREPAGRARFEAPLASADILGHGYRNGAPAGPGYDAATRRALAPALIDVSPCAWGWSVDRPARLRSLVQMAVGIAAAGMAWKGTDQPTPSPVQAPDHATGYAMAAAAVEGARRLRAEGLAATARLSLARMAALSMARPAAPRAPLAAGTEADLAPGVEATAWGPARRLRPALTIEGAPIRWDLPARRLGSDAPARE